MPYMKSSLPDYLTPEAFAPTQFIVQGYMLYPNDEDMRKKQALTAYIKNMIVEFQSQNKNGKNQMQDVFLQLCFEDILHLVDSPSFDELGESQVLIGFHGRCAGYILLSLLMLRDAGFQPSLKRAKFLAMDFLKELNNLSEKHISSSDRRIDSIWETYGCVSHFLAAHLNLYMLLKPDDLKKALQAEPLLIVAHGMQIASQIPDLIESMQRPPEELSDPWIVESTNLPQEEIPMPSLSDHQRESLSQYSSER